MKKRKKFRVGDEILLLDPMEKHPLSCSFEGLYTVCEKWSKVNYMISTDNRKKRSWYT